VTLTFTVYAVPMPRGNLTRMPNGQMIENLSRAKDLDKRREQRERQKNWPLDVQGAAFLASTAIANRRTEPVFGVDDEDAACVVANRLVPVFEGPVNVCARFFFPRPKNETKAERLRVFCTRKPDLDKLLRGVLDPMKKAGIYRDDAQVCGFAGTEKRYIVYEAAPEFASIADQRPRVEVTVTALQETE
jgi:Holliday junction resolvase RusA-like endonuclease